MRPNVTPRLIAALLAIALTAAASAQEQPAPQTPSQPTPDLTAPRGKVLFDTTQHPPEDSSHSIAIHEDPAATIPDAVRSALIFTAYDLDAHLVPDHSRLVMQARFIIRNSGAQPLTRIALQISSSLQWERFAQLGGATPKPIAFVQHLIDTDADHTGQAQEAILTLPQPLPPGASLQLSSFYSGTLAPSAHRLERIGAPPVQAAFADWDTVSPEGTFLRGYGNVLWYPVAAPPVFLGAGADLFQSVGRTRLQQSAATVRLRLAIEYTGEAPDAAFFCGRLQPLTAVSENSAAPIASAPGLATAEFSTRTLGFRVPSLFITSQPATLAGQFLAVITAHNTALPVIAAAAQKIQPLLSDWLGESPLTPLALLDHPGQPFEDDALLVAPLPEAGTGADPAALALTLSHSLTHAWFTSSHIWLDEGVPQFMSLLWLERTAGREVALQQLQQQVNTLALAEPDLTTETSTQQTTPQPPGQSLIQASDEIYYRTKAAAVLWMLRSVVGDEALQQTLHIYRSNVQRDSRQHAYRDFQPDSPADSQPGSQPISDRHAPTALQGDQDPNEFQRILQQVSHRDLTWLFDDWVYRDRGLPDLSIITVTPRELPARAGKSGGWLVAVEVHNDGDAVAEVPVTVRSGTLSATERLRIPARSSASTRIVFEGNPETVTVNDGSVPEITSSTHTRQLALHEEK